MSQKNLTGTDAVRSGLTAAAAFFLVLTTGLWVDRAYQQVTRPAQADIQTVDPGAWSNHPNGGLVADEETLDFGRVVRGTAFELELRLFNPSSNPVTISKFQGLCGANAGVQDLQIKPGEWGVVHIWFHNYAAESHAQRQTRAIYWPIIPEFRDQPGRHPGWKVGGTFCESGEE